MAGGKILMIDNYDSFTYNLVQFLGRLGADLVVYRNDHTDLEEVKDMDPAGIVISPGPKAPRDAGSVQGDNPRLRSQRTRSWGCAWGTSASGRSTAAGSTAPPTSCTARPRR